MKNEVVLSVIIPCFQAADGIRECLLSVISQTLKEIEILLIDAGSNDGTREIIEEFLKHDKRIRLIDSNVKSYGYQVNLGIREAKGKYISIVEPDDTIKNNMYETLLKKSREKDYDIIRASYYEVYRKTGKRNIKRVLNDLQWDVTAIWCGIYKRSFIEDNKIFLNETEGASFQDTAFHYLTYILEKESTALTENAFYEYTVDNSFSSVHTDEKWRFVNKEINYLYESLRERGLSKANIDTEKKEKLLYSVYRKYRRNRERVRDDELKEFYKGFYDDISLLIRFLGDLKRKYFKEEEEEDLLNILSLKDCYFEYALDKKKKFFRDLKKYKSALILGKGYVTKCLLKEFEGFKDEMPEIKYILTTDEMKKMEFDRELLFDSALIISSKLKENRDEMRDAAKRSGFKNIIRVPYEGY